MEKQILAEIKEIKNILAHLVGTIDKPATYQFSKPALDKAAKLFKELNIVKEQWVKSHDLGEYFNGGGGFGLGKFIREEFDFCDFHMKGNTYLYNKESIINLAIELKSRNIDLTRYMGLRREQSYIEQKIKELASKNRDTRVRKALKKMPYMLHDDLRDITISDYNLPELNVVEEDIKNLMQEFEKGGYESYIWISGDCAYITYEDKIREYLKGVNGTKHRSWCNKFNKAHIALKIIKEHQNK